jgi:hypothetical protein
MKTKIHEDLARYIELRDQFPRPSLTDDEERQIAQCEAARRLAKFEARPYSPHFRSEAKKDLKGRISATQDSTEIHRLLDQLARYDDDADVKYNHFSRQGRTQTIKMAVVIEAALSRELERVRAYRAEVARVDFSMVELSSDGLLGRVDNLIVSLAQAKTYAATVSNGDLYAPLPDSLFRVFALDFNEVWEKHGIPVPVDSTGFGKLRGVAERLTEQEHRYDPKPQGKASPATPATTPENAASVPAGNEPAFAPDMGDSFAGMPPPKSADGA